MPARQKAGLAFCLVTDAGWGVGVVTHDLPKLGSLVWIAEPTFEEMPTLEQVRAIARWRWPVLFPVTAALRRKIIDQIGIIDLPPELAAFPVLRSGDRNIGWVSFTENALGERQRLGPTNDRGLHIFQVVNDTRLREMIVSKWQPEDVW